MKVVGFSLGRYGKSIWLMTDVIQEDEIVNNDIYLSCDHFSSLFYLFISMARSIRNWFTHNHLVELSLLSYLLPKFLVSRSMGHNQQVWFNATSVTGLWVCKL